MYYVLGDNRDFSLDSRYWGFVPAEDILGVAKFIFYSQNFSRIGKNIH
jgi:signal peptidase I